MDMFEEASRIKLRFASMNRTPSGVLMVEDLWDLPLQSSLVGKSNLDDIGKVIRRQLKKEDDESLVSPGEKPNRSLVLAFEIIKHIIAVRQAEAKAQLDAKQKAERKQRIMAIMSDKQDEGDRSKSMEELQKELAEL